MARGTGPSGPVATLADLDRLKTEDDGGGVPSIERGTFVVCSWRHPPLDPRRRPRRTGERPNRWSRTPRPAAGYGPRNQSPPGAARITASRWSMISPVPSASRRRAGDSLRDPTNLRTGATPLAVLSESGHPIRRPSKRRPVGSLKALTLRAPQGLGRPSQCIVPSDGIDVAGIGKTWQRLS